MDYKLTRDRLKVMDTSTVHVQDQILAAKLEVWRHPSVGKPLLRYELQQDTVLPCSLLALLMQLQGGDSWSPWQMLMTEKSKTRELQVHRNL